MIKESVVVKADPGFDGRPIALLVQEASQYAITLYGWHSLPIFYFAE